MIFNIISICDSNDKASETPVTFVLDASQLGVNLAATGSVTAVKTIGINLVVATNAWVLGVAIPTIASGLLATNCLAIWAALALLPWALANCNFRFSPAI